MTGEVKKLVIQGYTDEDRKNKSGDPYTALVNPDKYALNYKVDYIDPKTTNSTNQPKYARTPPSEMDFEFLFDVTGIFSNQKEGFVEVDNETKDIGVEAQIQKFLAVAYAYNGKIHMPNYLTITWGTLIFNCLLTEVSIEYKLFDPNGKPLRAVAKAKFRSSIPEQQDAAKQGKSSPDLTHVRIVEEGDTLPLMTKRIYGDSKYYLEVAKANKLISFRKLNAGQRIIFPPVKKPQ